MNIPQLDLTRFAKTIHDEWLVLAKDIALSGKILNGPHKQVFEEEFAKFLGVKHVLGVASGTDAIYLALEAVGVRSGDEVITHANAFIACIEPILALGAKPVLVDMSDKDYGPNANAVAKAINQKTKAILAVHLLGMPVDLEPLLEISEKTGVPLVEDVAQAQGAMYKNKRLGTFGKINAFSLGAVKNLAALGDAGCVATDDDILFERVKFRAVHGQKKKYEHVMHGWNSRLDEVQAAWLRLGLKTLDQRNNKRREIYAAYKTAFADLPLSTMPSFEDRNCVYHQAIIETSERDTLQEYLKAQGVGTGIYYPFALHEQEAWKAAELNTASFPRAERYARQNLSLPIYAELTPEEVRYITKSVREFFVK